MSEDIRNRAARRAYLEPFRLALFSIILLGLVYWGIGALICHLLGVSSYYALAVALLLTVKGWIDERKKQDLDFVALMVEELEASLKEHVTKDLRDVSERLGEMDGKLSEVRDDLASLSNQLDDQLNSDGTSFSDQLDRLRSDLRDDVEKLKRQIENLE